MIHPIDKNAVPRGQRFFVPTPFSGRLFSSMPYTAASDFAYAAVMLPGGAPRTSPPTIRSRECLCPLPTERYKFLFGGS